MTHILHDGLGSSLTRPLPIGLFLLGAHEIFNVRDACGLVEDLVARELLQWTKLTRHHEFSTGQVQRHPVEIERGYSEKAAWASQIWCSVVGFAPNQKVQYGFALLHLLVGSAFTIFHTLLISHQVAFICLWL
ncbi:hypothetical protein TNCV_1449831 [Trichonephila clavipes]|nr:hypothetical protein TNCV_1449831 [Trichonephila clavipes]